MGIFRSEIRDIFAVTPAYLFAKICSENLYSKMQKLAVLTEMKKMTTLFFYKQLYFRLAPNHCLANPQNRPNKLFSSCL